MARRRSMFRRVLTLGVFALAVFGAWTLYTKYQGDVDNGVSKVMKKTKAVGKALEK